MMKKIKFTEIAELSKDKSNNNTNKNLPCIELEHIDQNTGILLGNTYLKEQKSIKNIFKTGDILFGKLRPYLRKFWLAEFDGVCSSEIWVLKNKNINKKYLYYYIQSEEFIRVCNITSGSKMPRADKEVVFNFPFSIVNSIPEQKAIADCLSTWDKGIEKLTALITAKKTQKKALMQSIFNDEERIKNWKEVKLGEVGETFNGLTGKNKNDFGFGKPYVSYLNVFKNSKIDEETDFDFVSISENENQQKLQYGDLIFTTSSETPNEVGMSSVVLFEPIEDLFLNSFCFGFRLNNFEILSPNFAIHVLREQTFRKEMYRLAQGSTRFNLSKTGFKKIKLQLPSLAEQERVANVLSTADKEIALLDQKLVALQTQKQGVMQVLLNGKLRIES